MIPLDGHKAVVTIVESDSRNEAAWSITVRRIPAFRISRDEPLAADVPADIRAALRAWLDSAATA